MEPTLPEIHVECPHRILDRGLVVTLRHGRGDADGEADAVLRIGVGQPGNRYARGEPAMAVASVHRIGTRGEGLALAPAIGRAAGMFAVDDVGGDRQHRLRVHRIAIGGMLADLAHEA